jgi:hypothetical protein
MCHVLMRFLPFLFVNVHAYTTPALAVLVACVVSFWRHTEHGCVACST